MKKDIVLILFVLVGWSYIHAETRYTRSSYYTEHHYLTLGGSAGYSSLIGKIPKLSTNGNIGGAIDFCYEYRIRGFWLNIGAEIQYLSASSSFNISGTDKMIYDTQGKQALMHYDLDQSIDKQEFVFANIPVVLGYYHNGLYIGAGAKIGYCIRASETTSLKYTTSATYSQYIDDFGSMSDHYYTSYSSFVTENLNTKYKISVIAEIGYDVLAYPRQINHALRSGLKLSAFIEYGLNNIIKTNQEQPLFSFNENNAAELNIHPFYNTNAAQSYKIHPLYVGMKITWIFNIETSKCPWCNVSENHRQMRKRYSRIQH